jgi:hypothetical protein
MRLRLPGRKPLKLRRGPHGDRNKDLLEAISRLPIPGGYRQFLEAVTCHADPDTGECWPTMARTLRHGIVSARTGWICGARSPWRWKRQAVEDGYLTSKRFLPGQRPEDTAGRAKATNWGTCLFVIQFAAFGVTRVAAPPLPKAAPLARAKVASECASCGGAIAIGDEFRWTGDRGGVVAPIHPRCPHPPGRLPDAIAVRSQEAPHVERRRSPLVPVMDPKSLDPKLGELLARGAEHVARGTEYLVEQRPASPMAAVSPRARGRAPPS